MPLRALFVAPILALAALTSDGAAAVQAEAPPRWLWSVVEVPRGGLVDLVEGTLLATPPAEDRAYMRGPDAAFQGNVELFQLERERPSGPRRIVGRDAARAGAGSPYLKGLEDGDELLWTHAEAWGYVRLLEHQFEFTRIELVTPAPATERLVREPAVLTVDAAPDGFSLEFDPGPAPAEGAPAPRWRIERRSVGRGVPFAEVALVDAPRYFDDSAPRERLVEWRVSRADSERPLGTTARARRVVHPGEWPQPLAVGMRIDLLSGALESSTAHVEVAQVMPPTVVLKPLPGTLLGSSGRPAAWQLPLRASFDPTLEGRPRAFAYGTELAALTPEGVIVRLELARQQDGSLALLREAALDGERALPRAPELFSIEAKDDGVHVRARPLPFEAERPELVALVVERELEPGRGDWEVCDEGPPGAREFVVPRALVDPPRAVAAAATESGAEVREMEAASTPLARLRVRQRYAFGARSAPTAPLTVLLFDPADLGARERLLDASILALDHPEWSRRDEARRVLTALGASALPRLEEVLLHGTPEAQNAVRGLLASEGTAAAGGLALLMSAEARRLGIEGAMPPDLVAEAPAVRAYALVRTLEDSERRANLAEITDALGWASLVARFDADAGVRGFADMLVSLAENGGGGLLRGAGELAALTPRERRFGVARGVRAGMLGSDTTLPLDARSLLRELERHPWLADREVGPVLGVMLASVRRAASLGGGTNALPDYDVETTDLALRLIGRFGRGRDARLLEAARGLFGVGGAAEWRLVLEGWREATLQRMADESAPPATRDVLELTGAGGAPPTLTDLESVLLDLRQSGRTYVDVVLPPGDYSASGGEVGHWVDLDVPGLRLRAAQGGAGAPRFTVGLRVMGARDVVLDGVRVEHLGGAALMVLDGGHVVVRGGALLGVGMGIQAQDADLELYGTQVGDAAVDRPGQFSVRHLGRGRIVARGSLFTGGSMYVGDFAEPYFERCVFDSGERPVLQAQREGRPIVRECLLRATGMGLMNVSGGCLAGVVLDVPRDPFGPRPDGLVVDPRWFVLVNAGQAVPGGVVLERSVIGGE